MTYFNKICKCLFRNYVEKDETVLYELALKRGKTRGWYPEDWTIADYQEYLFGDILQPKLKNSQLSSNPHQL